MVVVPPSTMADGDDDGCDAPRRGRLTVEAPDVDGVLDALGIDVTEDPLSEELAARDELRPVLATLVDVYGGVREATASDSRGRSRKLVRQFADREDLESEVVGHALRVLEAHDLVVQDGNRWRVADVEG